MNKIINHLISSKHYLIILGASVLYALGLSIFVTPLKLYSGGLMGVSQLLRTVLVDYAGAALPSHLDLSGVIYYVLNIPLLIMAYKKISRAFFIKTLLAITTITIVLSFTDIGSPLLNDTLTCCITGGILSGTAVGLLLRSGGSGGGLDILGMYLAKNYQSASVGKFVFICNLFLYLLCAVLFNIETAIYSIILSAVSAAAIDRIHYQNIMIKAMIFTKADNIAEPIMNRLHRGVTEWNGDGAYTQEQTHILVTVISKYEMTQLRRIVLDADSKAFITYSQVNSIDGNFLKRL